MANMKNPEILNQELAALKSAEPRLRNRDLAQRLDISEAELLCLSLGEGVTLLEGDWKKLLASLKDMGYLMALTRNEYAVHERKGVYDNIRFYEGPANVGVAVNPDIDLRFFMHEWRFGLAVVMPRGKMEDLYSFQFFNASGEAVHKVYSTPESDLAAYHRLVEQYKAPVQTMIAVNKSTQAPTVEKPDAAIDIPGFQQAWRDLDDTHDFYGLLKKFGVTRTQGLRLAPDGMALQVDKDAVVRVLKATAEQETPIMCFVHSPGCVQIHTGPVSNLQFYGDWYNVMDPEFNLHLDTRGIHQSWIVRKPTVDGIVTSLELFDEHGELIVYFFGKRKPGIPEMEEWRSIIEQTAGHAPSFG
ncbi:MAG: hemin-degrading factor [Lewinella sp.]|nr:hemin-degrading factor [Lewinella sp.]